MTKKETQNTGNVAIVLLSVAHLNAADANHALEHAKKLIAIGAQHNVAPDAVLAAFAKTVKALDHESLDHLHQRPH